MKHFQEMVKVIMIFLLAFLFVFDFVISSVS